MRKIAIGVGLNVDSIKTRIETLFDKAWTFRCICLNVDSIKTRIETRILYLHRIKISRSEC